MGHTRYLRGIHGGSYAPPTATGMPFADIPASSIYAPWIEQWVVEGIAAGCGGGNYCPDAMDDTTIPLP